MKSKIVWKIVVLNAHECGFENGVEVKLFLDEQIWEWYNSRTDEYLTGVYALEGSYVIDYDGCYSAPKELLQTFKDAGYKLDI